MESSIQDKVWRKCSSCKKNIELGSPYYVCSVSTCNGQRTGYVFCSVSCFESHLPGARHKSAGAIEKTAPRTPEISDSQATPRASQKIIIPSQSSTAQSSSVPSSKEVLIIASRLKDYIQERRGYNTSSSVMDVLSDHIRIITERAMDNARAEGRKTVLDRDFDFLKKS